LFQIHASRTNAFAHRLRANVPERLPGRSKNSQPTLITRSTSAIAKKPGELETLDTGGTGDHGIRNMWNETEYYDDSAGAGTKVKLQRWTRQSLFLK
jgi:hypothetical protein